MGAVHAINRVSRRQGRCADFKRGEVNGHQQRPPTLQTIKMLQTLKRNQLIKPLCGPPPGHTNFKKSNAVADKISPQQRLALRFFHLGKAPSQVDVCNFSTIAASPEHYPAETPP